MAVIKVSLSTGRSQQTYSETPSLTKATNTPALYHALVVEDNRLNQKVMQVMLTDLGCQVVIAEDGEQALELAKINPYDIIFMDIGLPKMDGLQAAQQIRQLPTCHDVPIIIITAHAVENDIARYRSTAINDVFIKPLTLTTLAAILARWTQAKKK